MSDRQFRSVVILCKRCAREFELRLPRGRPFLRMLDKAGIPNIGGDFARRKK